MNTYTATIMLLISLCLLNQPMFSELRESHIPDVKVNHPKHKDLKVNQNLHVNRTELAAVLSEVYSNWEDWSGCQESGVRVRRRLCKDHQLCGSTIITEENSCSQCELQENCEAEMNDNRNEEGAFHVVKESSSRSIKRLGTNLLNSAAGRSGTEYLENKGIYSKWSKWTTCTKSCLTQRFKWCKKVSVCGNEVIRQTAYCYIEGTYCQTWIQTKVTHEWMDIGGQSANNSVNNGYGAHQPTYGNELPPNSRGTVALQGKEDVKFSCGVVRGNGSSYASSNWNMVRIIGGRPTQQGKWPWQVAILNRFKEAFCGGTLVASKWVLTAAHCVRRRLYVRLGEHDLAQREGTELQMRVKKSVIHPSYNSETVDNDVALLRLPYAVPLDTFSVACLPRARQSLPTQQMCTIIGWGKRSNSDMFGTDILHEAEVPIISNKICRDVYEDYQITANMFCAGYRRGRKDSCAGDSGGPLLCKNSRGRWTVYGITSFGEGCGKKGKYGIYARLSNYVRWVKRVIGITSKRTKPL